MERVSIFAIRIEDFFVDSFNELYPFVHTGVGLSLIQRVRTQPKSFLNSIFILYHIFLIKSSF